MSTSTEKTFTRRTLRVLRGGLLSASAPFAFMLVGACGVQIDGLGSDPSPPSPSAATIDDDAGGCTTCDASAAREAGDATTSGTEPPPATDDAGVDAAPPNEAPDTGPAAPACHAAADCDSKYCIAGACAIAPSCSAIHAIDQSLPSGVYAVKTPAGAATSVYCDMVADGGGWTLAAKVHRHHQGFAAYVEPRGFFAAEADVPSLLDDTSYENRLPGVAAHGSAILGSLAATASLARFQIVAENAPTTRASWFKQVKPDLWTWFTATTTQTASTVCTDVGMTANCSQGLIAWRSGECLDATCLEGMSMANYGLYVPSTAPRFIAMRLQGDADDTLSGVCSSTFNDPRWADSDNEHWGNGLMVWLR